MSDNNIQEGDPVIAACQKGNLEDVKTFIESGIDVNTYEGKAIGENANVYTLLGAASLSEKLEIVQYLLSLPNINVDVQDTNGKTCLMWAAISNKQNLNVMNALLDHKTCTPEVVNAQDNSGHTALFYAGSNAGLLKDDIIKLLKFYSDKVTANLCKRYYNLFPNADPVIAACGLGQLQDLKTFIGSGIDVNTYEGKAIGKNANVYTLLGAASLSEELEIVQYLLRLPNINVGVQDTNGKTCLMWAAISNKQNLNVMNALLDHKTCTPEVVNAQDNSGHTALFYAESNDGLLKDDIIKLLKSKMKENTEARYTQYLYKNQ